MWENIQLDNVKPLSLFGLGDFDPPQNAPNYSNIHSPIKEDKLITSNKTHEQDLVFQNKK